jgi:hypothetical protein
MFRRRHLPLLAPVAVLLAVVGLAWKAQHRRATQAAAPPDAVLEFRLLLGTRLDEATKKPVFREALRRLDGRPVVIAGYMTASPASDDPTDFRGFRLVENAPGTLMRPPAANEAIYVERRLPDTDTAAAPLPHIPGSLAVRGTLRLAGYSGKNRGLAQGYWFAIEDAEIDPLGKADAEP